MIFRASFAGYGVLNRDPTVWLDGARPPIVSLIMSLTNLQFYKLVPYKPHQWLVLNPITVVNDDSSVVNKLDTSLIDDARDVIYDCHMFIVQATGLFISILCHTSWLIVFHRKRFQNAMMIFDYKNQ